MVMTAADFLDQLRALLPQGEAWHPEPGTEQGAILTGLSKEFARIDSRARDLLRELNPATAVELLPEWEELYDVPAIAGATLQQRQTIAAWYHSHGGDIKQPYFVELATALGYAIRIDEYKAPIIGFFAIGDMLVFEEWQEFSAGVSGAGDSLGMESTPALLPACWLVVVQAAPATLPEPTLEEIMADIKPAHIHLNFIYL